MKIRNIALFTATLFAAGTAFGFHCPQDMKKIDDAMAKNPKLTAAQADEVKKYRAEGETLHKAGKHQESIDTLAKAQKILERQVGATRSQDRRVTNAPVSFCDGDRRTRRGAGREAEAPAVRPKSSSRWRTTRRAPSRFPRRRRE